LEESKEEKTKTTNVQELDLIKRQMLASVHCILEIVVKPYFEKIDWKKYCHATLRKYPAKEAFKFHIKDQAERYANLLIKFRLPFCLSTLFIDKMVKLFMEKNPAYYGEMITMIQIAAPLSLSDIDNAEATNWKFYQDFIKSSTTKEPVFSEKPIIIDRTEPDIIVDPITGEEIVLRLGSPEPFVYDSDNE